MTTEFTNLSAAALVWLAAYFVHSTLLLGLAWLATRVIGQRSFALQDQIWKLALVLPLLTATIQQAAGPSPLAIARWTIASTGEVDEADHEPRQESPIVLLDRASDVVAGTPDIRPGPEFIDNEELASMEETDGLGNDSAPVSSPDVDDWTIVIEPAPAGQQQPVPEAELPPLHPDALAAVPEVAAHQPLEELWNCPADPGPREPALIPASNAIRATPSDRISTLLSAAGALICLHLLLASLRLIRLAWSEHRHLAMTAAIDAGEARQALDRILASRRIQRPVQLRSAKRIRGPAACGWWRWKIILPAGLEHEMPRDEFRALLAHELAHLVRRDPIWLWWSRAVCILLPVQPLSFLARRRWEEAAEYLCDAWAVESDIQPLTMAKCLTRVADRALGGAATIGLTAVGRQSTLSRRIERLTAGRIARPSHGRTTRFAALIVTTAVTTATVIGAPQVSFTGDDVSTPDPVRGAGNNHPREEHLSGDEGPVSPPVLDSRAQLHNEFQTLLADLDRLNELLAGVDDSPELSAARAQMQRRLQRIRDRGLGAIDESDPDAWSVRGTDEAD